MRIAFAAVFLLAFSIPASAQEVACAPSGFQAERLGVVIELTWDDMPGATSYTIYRAREAGNFTPAIVVSAPANHTIDTQVEAGFNYTYYAVATVAGAETPTCGQVHVASGGPCSPRLAATADGERIHLVWSALPVADAYRVYRDGDLLATTDASTQSHTDTEVVTGTAYTYEVRAVVDGEERPACGSVTATAIPFFPGAAGLAALVVASLAYVGLRRR